MARQTGANNFAGTLEVLAAAPLDARSVIPTKADLTASGNFPYPYIGMQTYVVAENKRYTLIGSDPTVLANWREDGSGSGSSIQVTSLPTASVTELGNVYQYIGTTTASYTNGYFYKCISDGAVTPTYSWVQLNVQPSGGSGGGSGIIANATLLASGWNSTTKQQTLTFNDYDEDMGGVIGVPTSATSAQKEEYATAIINVVAQTGNQFTFECEEVPTIDLPVTLYAGGGSGGGSADLPSGGTTGQALVKRSNADGDVEWQDPSNSVFEIHFANDAVDVGYSQLGEALAANKILKLVDTVNNVILAFTGYYSGVYYFSTICLNKRQEMVNTSIVLYQTAPSSDVVATQVQRLTLTEDVQKTEIPTASSTYLNKIYQYIGTTDANYTNGLFYRCVQNGSTYSWQECETQHRLTASEMADIMSTLPGAPTQYPKYSTTEQVVGEWIDGKPIYQKTFTGTVSTGSTTISISSLNISTVVNMFGLFGSNANGLSMLNYFVVPPNEDANGVTTYILNNNINIVRNQRTNPDPYILTLQYTKTTD